jgi:glycerol-1-phosphate dehydrogenase [NAD(P)+]
LPDELYEPRIAAQAESILEYLMSQKIAISKTSDSGLETLAQALAAEVELCNVYGNSRPEEGSEHFFAYALEPELPRATHAELVGIGILISAYIQKQNVNLMKDFMDSVGMNYLPVGITPTIISSVLDNMQEYVITHGLRYSIWNEYSRQADDVHRITDLIGL